MSILKTALVSMPWANVHSPSIQLGTLESVLRRREFPVCSFSLYLKYAGFLYEKAQSHRVDFTLRRFYDVLESTRFSGVDEWIFAGAPLHNPPEAEVDRFVAALQLSEEEIDFVLFARQQTPAFLDYSLKKIMRWAPDIVGFTSTFSQHVPSLTLSKLIKTCAPDTRIVFGGANCEGVMGETLIRCYPHVDYVVRGEGEYALPHLIEAIAGDASFDDIPGLCYRAEDGVRVNGFSKLVQVDPEHIPEPTYDEYFSELARSAVRKQIDANVWLPVESSRGCWWGAKHHCTFCGLNGLTMAFRSKSSPKFVDELVSLSRTFSRTRFQVTDNIIDMQYFKTVLPELAALQNAGCEFTLFYETKSNLKKEQVAALAAAGVKEIQPGIESLVTRVLKLIDKGVTGLQNVQLLKWASEYGIRVSWNLIYGFPGESEDDWEQTLALIPLLNHLQPPRLTPLLLERFSPYFDRSDHFSIENIRPMWWYNYLYPFEESTLKDMVYYFSHTCSDTASMIIIDRVRERLNEIWNAEVFESRKSSLTYTRGPGFVTISDGRRLGSTAHTTLRGLSARVFLECDAIATARGIAESLSQDFETVSRICEKLVELRILLREGDRYLALPTSPRRASNAGLAHLEAPVSTFA